MKNFLWFCACIKNNYQGILRTGHIKNKQKRKSRNLEILVERLKKKQNSVVVSLETGLHCFFSGIFTFGSIVNLHYIGVGKSLTETYIFIAP